MTRRAVYAALLTGLAAAAWAQSAEQAQMDFANGLFQRGFFAEAADEYDKYLKDYPKGERAAEAWLRLGRSAQAAGNYEKAVDAYTTLLGLSPGESARLAAAAGKGESLYNLKKLPDAEAVLVPLTGEGIPAEIRGRALYYLGKVHAEAGDSQAAVKDFQTLADTLPDDPLAPYARYQLGFAYLAANDLENAALAFSAVAGADVDTALRAESRYRAAEVYDRIGWFSAAIGAYEQLKKDYPDSEYAKRADYGYAWALYRGGKAAAALEAAEAFLKANPDSDLAPGILFLRGNCLQEAKDFEGALAVYADIAKRWPDSPFAVRAAAKTAWAHYLHGDVPEAKAEATAFLQQHADDAAAGDAAFLLGTILVIEGNYEDAQEQFRLVAERFPTSEFGPEALYKSGECLEHLGMTDQAANAFETFVKQYPGNPLAEQAMLRAADVEFNADDFAPAVEKYKKILEKPGDDKIREDTLYRLAITYHNMKKFSDSADTFRDLLKAFPQSAHAAEAHFRAAEYLLREKGAAVEAIAEYQAALDAKPEGDLAGRTVRGLGLAYYEQKDFAKAADLFLKLMEEYPDVRLNDAAYGWTGDYFTEQKDWDKASRSLEGLLKANPDYPAPERVWFRMAECREASGDSKGALELFEKVTKDAPASAKALEAKIRMASLREAAGDAEGAIALLEETAKTNNSEMAARARYRLGELYEQNKDYEKAARSYMYVAIVFLFADLSPEALWRAGQCFLEAGNLEQARKAFTELTADFPDHADAKKAKDALAAMDAGKPPAPELLAPEKKEVKPPEKPKDAAPKAEAAPKKKTTSKKGK